MKLVYTADLHGNRLFYTRLFSEAARVKAAAFISKYRPPLVLSGHVHESPGASGHITHMIGGTLCVNPGQTVDELRAVTVAIPDYRVDRLNIWSDHLIV